MRLLFLLILISTSFFGQSTKDLQNQNKLNKYLHLDNIDVYSKDYPSKLIEGSGFILNKKNKNIGSIGYSINITKDKNNKIIRVLKSESDHYDEKPQKSIIWEITIYYDELEQPDMAKYISETFISNSLVTKNTKLFNLKEIGDDTDEFMQIKDLLSFLRKKHND